MKVYEFGKENTKSFVMFQCAVEPWWVFRASAEEMAKDCHVYLMIADGHDALGTEFVSLEKYAKDAAVYLKTQGVDRIDAIIGTAKKKSAQEKRNMISNSSARPFRRRYSKNSKGLPTRSS